MLKTVLRSASTYLLIIFWSALCLAQESPGGSIAKDSTSSGVVLSLIAPDSISLGLETELLCLVEPPSATGMFRWDVDGDGHLDCLGSSSVLTFVFEVPGAVTVSCTTDINGDRAVAYKTVVVSRVSTVDAGGPYSGQVNAPVLFEGRTEHVDGRIVSYSWDFDNDDKYDWSSSQGSRSSHVFRKSGEYLVRFKVTLDDGRAKTDVAQVIIVNEPPKAYAGQNVVSTAGKAVLLKGTGKDSDGTIVKYEWDFDGDGSFDWSSTESGELTRVFTAFTTAVLRVTDSDGAFAVDTVRIVICPEDMQVDRENALCIDRYEWPNRKGVTPLTSITLNAARDSCERVGKRLCSSAEWAQACRGASQKPNKYPYGNRFIVDNCNTLGNSWALNHVAQTGYFPRCRSRWGVFDMSGNVAEWTDNGNIHGGFWNSGAEESSCGAQHQGAINEVYFYVGFRCCK